MVSTWGILAICKFGKGLTDKECCCEAWTCMWRLLDWNPPSPGVEVFAAGDKEDIGNAVVGVAPSPLQPQEYLENVRVGFRSEDVELEEVSELPSEEVEVLEQSFEGVLDEGLEWREHVVVMGLLEGA